MIDAWLEYDGRPLRRVGERLVVPEASRLVVRVQGGPCAIDLDGRALPWDGAIPGVAVALPHAVGALRLTIRRGDQQRRFDLRVVPAPSKLGDALWAALVDDLWRWLPELLAGVAGPRAEGLALGGLRLPAAIEACLPLLPELYDAIDQVGRAPRLRELRREQDVALHQLRTLEPATLGSIARHPRLAVALRGPATQTRAALPLELPDDTLDHPANRHLVWLVERVARELRAAADALRGATVSTIDDSGAWRDARVEALEGWATELLRRRRRGWLRTIPAAPASGSALLVLTDAPLYARVQRQARRVLRLGLARGPEEVATRPSFHLYELWTLLATARALQEHLGSGWEGRWTSLRSLTKLDGSGGGAAFTLRRGEAEVELLFNPTFPSMLRRPDVAAGGGRHALTRERRPDLVLAWRSGARTGWVTLDAKYRAGFESLAEAFGSAHIYRDSLRWPDRGGRPVYAALLVPAVDDAVRPWFQQAFLADHRVGAARLAPGASVRDALAPVLDLLPRDDR